MRSVTYVLGGIVAAVALPQSAFALQTGRTVIVDGQRYEQTRCSGWVSGFVDFSQEIWIRADQRQEAEQAYRRHLETYGRKIHEFACESAGFSDDEITQVGSNNLSDWTGGYPTRPPEAKPVPTPTKTSTDPDAQEQGAETPAAEPELTSSETPAPQAPPAPAAEKPAWQVKYEREMEEYRQAVEQREARLREIEDIKAAQQREHEAARVRAESALRAHEAELEKAAQAERDYQEKLRKHREVVASLSAPNSDNAVVGWREAVTVCSLDPNNPQSKLGNWKCTGPLQFTYAKLGEDGAAIDHMTLGAISMACGGDASSVRYLGKSGVYQIFGCSYGLHPEQPSAKDRDMAARFGIDYIADRAVYQCPRSASSCRSK